VFFFLAFCVIALTLVSASWASDFIVLYSEDEKQLEVEYGSNFVCYIIMLLSSKNLNFKNIYTYKNLYFIVKYVQILAKTSLKNLKLSFYEDCINKDPSVCTPKPRSNAEYLSYFSDSEKQECKHFEKISQSMNDVLQFCVEFDNSSWFGGAEVGLQEWPLNKLNWTDREYVTKELHSQAVSIDSVDNYNNHNKLQN